MRHRRAAAVGATLLATGALLVVPASGLGDRTTREEPVSTPEAGLGAPLADREATATRQRAARDERDIVDDLLGPDHGPSKPYGSRKMKPGSRGTDVAELQRYLTRLGLKTAVDGRYGKKTRRNVRRYEAWRYMRANGVVDRRQAKKIRRDANSGERYRHRNHVFPVRGPHNYGGSGSRFGAPRGGRAHNGQDVAAGHGTKLVAVHDGRVAYRQYQAGGAGHYLVIEGTDGSDSVYMHLPRRSPIEPGTRVLAGEKIGAVGSTGASTGPHLHFELWTPHWFAGGSTYDPLRKLLKWDRRT